LAAQPDFVRLQTLPGIGPILAMITLAEVLHARKNDPGALELTAKARRLRRPVAEVPTIWLDRTMGESNFDLKAWIPRYLRWYRYAFGGPLTVEEVKASASDAAAAPTAQEEGNES